MFKRLMLSLLLFVSANTHAIVAVDRPFEQLVALSDGIMIGSVEQIESNWENGHIYTYVSFKVSEVLKGEQVDRYTVRMLGGSVPPVSQTVVGAPHFTLHERYTLFIQGNQQQIFPFVGVNQGIYRILTDYDGSDIVVSGAEEHLLKKSLPLRSLSLVSQKKSGVLLSDFKTQIKQQLQSGK